MSGKGLESLLPKKHSSVPKHTPVPPPVKREMPVAPRASAYERHPEPQVRPNISRPSEPKTPVLGKSFPIAYATEAMHREPMQYERSEVPTEEAMRYVSRGAYGLPHYPPAHIKREAHPGESVFQIEVDKIKPNPYQPRKEFNELALEELSLSVREFGILQPLVVSKVVKETDTGTEVEYQLIAGERRLLAARRIGLPRVPAIVRKVDDKRLKLELALIENIQRSDLSSIDSARGYARLQEEFGLTQREIAARVGKSREVIANTVRLLQLPLEVQNALSRGDINDSHARALLGISDPKEQIRVFQNLLDKKTTVREMHEKLDAKPDPQKNYWEAQLEEKLGTPVKVTKKGKHGKVVIQFYSEEEWQSILDKLLGEMKEM